MTVCLNMIVKDERPVILSCLSSVKPLIDTWVIVDTGSTDGTQQIIREYLADIPGELFERPWVNFAHNRNLALDLAKNKGDYLLFLDADEQLIVPANYRWPSLTQNCYVAKGRYLGRNDIEFARILLIDNRLDWEWTGIIHEAINGRGGQYREGEYLPVQILTDLGGSRSKNPQKTLDDAKTLEAALEQEPANSRYQFYLALSYDAGHEPSLALKNYKKRSQMSGNEEEMFYSLFRIARLEEELGAAKEIVIASYQRAFRYRPTRAEPLYYLARFYCQDQDYIRAYDTAHQALKIPQPPDMAFVEPPIYEYERLWLLARCSFELNRFDETHRLFLTLLSTPTLPKELRKQIEHGLPILESRSV